MYFCITVSCLCFSICWGQPCYREYMCLPLGEHPDWPSRSTGREDQRPWKFSGGTSAETGLHWGDAATGDAQNAPLIHHFRVGNDLPSDVEMKSFIVDECFSAQLAWFIFPSLWLVHSLLSLHWSFWWSSFTCRIALRDWHSSVHILLVQPARWTV